MTSRFLDTEILMTITTDAPLVSVSLMCCDPLRLGEEIQLLATAGVGLFHIDVMDGYFVPNSARSLRGWRVGVRCRHHRPLLISTNTVCTVQTAGQQLTV